MSNLNTYEIKIDYDGKSKKWLEKRIHKTLEILFGMITFSDEHCLTVFRKSRHGNYHVIVKLWTYKKFQLIHIVALQAIMGSDFKRECYNFLRTFAYKDMDEFQEWGNVLFKKRDRRFKVVV